MKWSKLIAIICIMLLTVACTNEKLDEKAVEQNKVISEADDWKESSIFKVDQYEMIGKKEG